MNLQSPKPQPAPMERREPRIPAGTVAPAPSVPPEVKFTNLDKVMFRKRALTKGDLINYYQMIAPLLMPYLKNRPITLERLPEGLSGKKAPALLAKEYPEFYPAWIPRARMPAEDGRPVNYALVNNEQTLLILSTKARSHSIRGSRQSTIPIAQLLSCSISTRINPPSRTPFKPPRHCTRY